MVQSPVGSYMVPQRLILSSVLRVTVLSNNCIKDLKDEVGCTLIKVAGGKKTWENVNTLTACDAI